VIKKSFTSLLTRFAVWRDADYILLLLALGVLAAIVLPTIARESIWFDEAFSAYITQFSYLDIARYTATDVHPPLYYWVLKAWESLFGYGSELVLRSLSLVFAGITAIFGFLIVRKLFGRKAALLALLFVVISPMVIRYSAEARMYMLESAIIFAATYVMIKAQEQKRMALWVLYGVLVALGMWTHYFTALAWLAHWVWRFVALRHEGIRGKKLAVNFFSKQWIIAHIVAIGVYLPWVPFMLSQVLQVQGNGFWIGPVSVDTIPNFFTNIFMYLEHGEVQGWVSLLLIALVSFLAAAGVRAYKSFNADKKRSFLLITALALVPIALLIIASMPPLRPTFVDRYLIPSIFAAMLLLGIVVAYGLKKLKIWQQLGVIAVIVAVFIFGISNVFYYGNLNKNNGVHIMTKQLIEQVHEKAKPGEPIIAVDSWLYYEAAFYSTPENPVYYIESDEQFIYGSQDMLRYDDRGKIKDVDAFIAEHPTVWYIANTNADAAISKRTEAWQPIQTLSAHDSIRNVANYKATQYRTSAE
jgi:mannosyltransferase